MYYSLPAYAGGAQGAPEKGDSWPSETILYGVSVSVAFH